MKPLLEIKDLHSVADEKHILKGLNLTVNPGEIHVIMGPNGAGKSTLANVIMGHPKHELTEGQIFFDGEEINETAVDERARRGLFLSFQYPEEIPGVTVENFLRTSKSAVTGKKYGFLEFHKLILSKIELLGIKKDYLKRYLNVGFSGGEKKKNEILQMAVLEPKLAFLDETDSGLDIDAIKTVAEGVKKLTTENNAMVVITHYNKIIDYLQPDFVHVLVDGQIVKTGDIQLANDIDQNGFGSVIG